MELVLGHYRHSTIGYPRIVLNWFVERGQITDSYWTEKGIIKRAWPWQNIHPLPFIKEELDRFDTWTRQNYSEDISVQG